MRLLMARSAAQQSAERTAQSGSATGQFICHTLPKGHGQKCAKPSRSSSSNYNYNNNKLARAAAAFNAAFYSRNLPWLWPEPGQNWPQAATTIAATTTRTKGCKNKFCVVGSGRDLNIFLATHNCMHIKREEARKKQREKQQQQREESAGGRGNRESHKGLAHEIFWPRSSGLTAPRFGSRLSALCTASTSVLTFGFSSGFGFGFGFDSGSGYGPGYGYGSDSDSLHLTCA